METFYLVFFLWFQDVGEKLLSNSPECNPSLSSLRFVFSPHPLPLIVVCVCVCVFSVISETFFYGLLRPHASVPRRVKVKYKCHCTGFVPNPERTGQTWLFNKNETLEMCLLIFYVFSMLF